jgi:DNA mismatch endonuclease (patch repair protein)
LVDVLSPAQRRKNMQRIRSKDTQPELRVRRLIHSLGYRYRLHARELPGRPDLVFRTRRKAIFVHGCYWHVHSCALGRVVPATNAEFWRAKRQGNVDRDVRNLAVLRDAGWEALVIWQCEISDVDALTHRIREFLEDVR